AIPFNIDFVVDGLDLRPYFSTIVSADDVTLSKPHPETFLKAAQLLGVAPADCLVFEDVPKGVEAAARAEATIERRACSYPALVGTRYRTTPGGNKHCLLQKCLQGRPDAVRGQSHYIEVRAFEAV
nr:hypothetical protein [Tanacetum cinerariifolium]